MTNIFNTKSECSCRQNNVLMSQILILLTFLNLSTKFSLNVVNFDSKNVFSRYFPIHRAFYCLDTLTFWVFEFSSESDFTFWHCLKWFYRIFWNLFRSYFFRGQKVVSNFIICSKVSLQIFRVNSKHEWINLLKHVETIVYFDTLHYNLHSYTLLARWTMTFIWFLVCTW